MKTPISILAVGSISPLGSETEKIWKAYNGVAHYLTFKNFGEERHYVGQLSDTETRQIEDLRSGNKKYIDLDKSVLYAIFASRKAVKEAGWKPTDHIGINIGSSRGATDLFERYFENYLRSGSTSTLASPNTTLGNISSWVAQDLMSSGPDISHSVTCSTGLHAVLNAVAWIQAGMVHRFIAGGSEAALTPFTMSQMRAMRIIANKEKDYPCEALVLRKRRNSMVLGEGAAVVALEAGTSSTAIAQIAGIGYSTEALKHPASISANGTVFVKSMQMALGNIPKEEVDIIVMHAPGTVKGDLSEYKAILSFFGKKHPALTSNKWKIGHTFGASGVMSLELAVLMLIHQQFIPVPFSEFTEAPKRIKYVLINAVGFGGNAVSVLLRRSK